MERHEVEEDGPDWIAIAAGGLVLVMVVVSAGYVWALV